MWCSNVNNSRLASVKGGLNWVHEKGSCGGAEAVSASSMGEARYIQKLLVFLDSTGLIKKRIQWGSDPLVIQALRNLSCMLFCYVQNSSCDC